jgi:hypothetical protein
MIKGFLELLGFIWTGICFTVRQWFCKHDWQKEEWQETPICKKCCKEQI